MNMNLSRLRGGGLTRMLIIVVAGVLLIAGLTTLLSGGGEKRMTAMFPRTVSVYEGSDVRVLGVKVGSIEKVEPAGTTVKVEMVYDDTVKVPEDVKAAIIAPSVVGDRYVQLTPVYQEGPQLKDGATLDTDRTAVPLELDDIYQNLSDLAEALGPDGANSDGALTRLLDSTARNFGGQGKQFNQTIRDLSRFTTTLDNRKDDLFGTAREIEVFVKALADNDQTVRQFNDSLQAAANMLEEEREDLAAALRNLGVAMTHVRGFVQDNEASLSRNIKGLVRVTDTFVKRRTELEETLSAAPVALANLFHTYNPGHGTLDTRTTLTEAQLLDDPLIGMCGLIGSTQQDQICKDLVEAIGLELGDMLPAPGRAATGPEASADRANRPIVIEPIDTTLAGILGEAR
jgi:phospholipid/cholesterol/gamma-HCH transport system substrate-binding protein